MTATLTTCRVTYNDGANSAEVSLGLRSGQPGLRIKHRFATDQVTAGNIKVRGTTLSTPTREYTFVSESQARTVADGLREAVANREKVLVPLVRRSGPNSSRHRAAEAGQALVAFGALMLILSVVGGLIVGLNDTGDGYETEYGRAPIGLAIAVVGAFNALIAVTVGYIGQAVREIR